MLVNFKRASNLCLHLTRHTFSSSKADLIAMHKAVIASKIIKKIANTDQKTMDSGMKSLKTEIIDEINEYPQNIVHDSSSHEISHQQGDQEDPIQIAKSSLRSFFIGGTWVHQDLCSQKRFQRAGLSPKTLRYAQLLQMNQNVQKNTRCVKSDIENHQVYKKLTFIPTYIITGQVFRKILSNSRSILQNGQYGVGKTYSFILYRMLSQIIFRYRFLQISLDKRYEKFLSQINFKVPKAVYCSLNLQKEITPQQIQNIILRQTYQLEKSPINFDDLASSDRSVKGLSEFYDIHLGIKLISFFDQINEIASVVRIYLYYERLYFQMKKLNSLQQNKKKSAEGQFQSIKEIYTQNVYSYFKVKSIIKFFEMLERKKHFSSIIFLSSVSIEKKLVRELRLTGKTNHSDVPIERFSYPTKLTSDTAILDFSQFIASNIEKKLVSMNDAQNNQQINSKELQEFIKTHSTLLSQMRISICEIVKKNSFTMNLPLSIEQVILSKSLSASQIFKSFHRNNSSLVNTQTLLPLLKQIENQSQLSLFTKVTDFLSKQAHVIGSTIDKIQQQHTKKLLLFRLLIQAKIKIRQIAQIKEYNHFPRNQTDYIMVELDNEFIEPKQQLYVEKNLFILTTSPNSKLAFLCCINPLLLIKVISSLKRIFFRALLRSNTSILKHVKGVGLGIFVQSLYIDLLTKGGSDFQFYMLKGEQGDLETFNMLQIPQKIQCFLQIPRTNELLYDNYSFLQGFQRYFDKTRKNPQQSNKATVFLPLSRQYIDHFDNIIQRGIKVQSEVDERSKLIDFIVAIKSFSDTYSICAFDITTTTDKQKVLSKICRFLKEFLNFKDAFNPKIKQGSQSLDVSLFYFVLAPFRINLNWSQYLQKIPKEFQKNLEELRRQTNKNKKAIQEQEQKLKRWNQLQFIGRYNTFEIRMKNPLNPSQKILLKRVGVISFFDDVTITNNYTNQIELDLSLINKLKAQYAKNNKSFITSS